LAGEKDNREHEEYSGPRPAHALSLFNIANIMHRPFLV